jgi:hypothetical protein
VQKLGGLLFAYMGPDPARAPLLPRWDVLVREDGKREIKMFPTHACNWLQIQENTADSTHTFFLHGVMDQRLGLKHPFAPYYRRPIEKLEFSYCEWGIDKVIVYGGDVPEKEIRPPLIFPNILRIPNGPMEVMHWRVPIDDTSTRIVFVAFTPAREASVRTREEDEIPYTYLPPMKTADGEYDLKSFFSQDQMAQESQGAIYDRANENLGVSDRGIVLFRKMLLEQIERVERGEGSDGRGGARPGAQPHDRLSRHHQPGRGAEAHRGGEAVRVKPLRLGIAGTGIAALQVLPHLAALAGKVELAALADVRRANMDFFCERYGRAVRCTTASRRCARSPTSTRYGSLRRIRCMRSTRSSLRATAST